MTGDEACAVGDSSSSGSGGGGAAKESEGGRERAQWEDSCSPLHSPSSRSDGNNEELSDIAEEKSSSRIDKSGQLFSPRDNNIEDVNMAIIGAKMGDKGTSPLTSPAKDVPDERGHKVVTVSSPENREMRERNSPTETASPSHSGSNLSTPGIGSVLGSRGGRSRVLPLYMSQVFLRS